MDEQGQARSDGGVVHMVFPVVLILTIVLVVLVMRLGAHNGRAANPGTGGPARRPRPTRTARPAPDDDPEFIRELERRARRDDGSPS